MKETILWIIVLILTVGLISNTIRLNKVETELEYQEVVDNELYSDIHQLAHKEDSCWVYEN